MSAHTQALTNQPSSTAASAYTAMTPMRLLDTRATGQTMGPGTTLTLPVVTAADGVPSDATAVALNVTVTNTTDSGYLSVYPTGGTQPYVSNLNWTMGETVPNAVIVPVGSGGSVTFYNHTGNTDVVVDLQGYFAPEANGSTAGAYVPLTPARITDTRTGSGYPNAGKTLGPNSTLNVQVTGVGGVPAGATGAVLNVTVTNTTDSGYLTAFPEGATQPTASNLNWTMGETVANRVLVSLSATGMITLYNHTGNTDVIVDVSGYFTADTTLPSNASLYTAITPTRLVDTRVSGGTLGAGGTYTAQIAGMGGIAADATAGVLNVTATNTTASSFFTVFPAGSTMPTASDVNWAAGQTVPNLTVATLSSSGAIEVYNHAGSADLVIDAFGYFSPFVAPIVSVTTNHTSVAEGGTATITATVTDSSLHYADPVQFTVAGAGCGSVSPTTGSVAASGDTATTTYTAGSTVGNCVITAEEASGLNTGSVTIATTVPLNGITLTAPTSNPDVINAGSTLFPVTVQVTNAAGDVSGDSVGFAGVGTPTAACGALSSASATTNASGNATVYYTPSSTSGFCDLTATEAGTGNAVLLTIQQKAVSNVPTDLRVAVSTSKTLLVDNGTATSTITITTTNGGLPYANDPVEVQALTGTCGTLSGADANGNAFVVTNASGVATLTYTSGTAVGPCSITALDSQVSQASAAGWLTTLGASLTKGTPTSGLTLTADEIIAASSSLDLWETTAGANSNTQTFTGASTVGSSTAVTLATSQTPNYSYALTTTDVVLDGGAMILQYSAPTPANTITLSPTTYTAVAGSGNTVAVTVTVTNSSGPVGSDVLTYTQSGDCGALSSGGGTTGNNGQVSFGYITAGTIGFCSIAVTDGSGGSATFSATAS